MEKNIERKKFSYINTKLRNLHKRLLITKNKKEDVIEFIII